MMGASVHPGEPPRTSIYSNGHVLIDPEHDEGNIIIDNDAMRFQGLGQKSWPLGNSDVTVLFVSTVSVSHYVPDSAGNSTLDLNRSSKMQLLSLWPVSARLDRGKLILPRGFQKIRHVQKCSQWRTARSDATETSDIST